MPEWLARSFDLIDSKESSRVAPAITIDDSFEKQWEFVTCEERFICVMCSRRAAKTTGAIRRVAKRSLEQPGRRTLYIHHTRGLGKAQFFSTGEVWKPNLEKWSPGLVELLEHKGVDIVHKNETEVNLRLANGSFVQVVGCDDSRDVGKKLGFFWDEIIIDECQEFHDEILVKLVDKTILPTLIDNAGTLILMGTPADVEVGIWYDTIMGVQETAEGERRPVAHALRWTLLDNPFIDRDDIVSTMALRGYVIDFEHPENNPSLIRREIFGHQVIDASKLEYEYLADVNDYEDDELPDPESDYWRFAMGIDIGGPDEHNDKDACVVLGWTMDDPHHRIWERESWEANQDSEVFVARVLETYNRWKHFVSVCADTGGAGAASMIKVLANRFRGLQMTPKPTSVEVSMRLLNDEFRSRRLRTRRGGLISRDCKLCLKGGSYHSDVMPATRYAQHGALNYAAKDRKKTEETLDQRRHRVMQERKAKEIDLYGLRDEF